MELPPPTPRLRVIQRSALALLVFAGVVNYIDRGTLSIANPLIRKELGLSLGDMGLLLSAFLWAYAFSQLPAGGLVDRLGPRRLMAAGMALWSLAQAAGGLAQGFTSLFVARFALGIGESPMYPTCGRGCATGSRCATVGAPPASLIVPPRSARRSRPHSPPCS